MVILFIYWFGFLSTVLSQSFNPFTYLQTSLISDSTTQVNHQSCLCVPYWQCKEDLSGLVEDGVDIIDIRVLREENSQSSECTGDFDVCCQIECGRRNNGFEIESRMGRHKDVIGFRILGEDNEAEFAEFPWMLGILQDKVYKCGASLIHPEVAITAAHCVSGKKEKYQIRAGEWNWESRDEPIVHQDRTSKKIIIHQQYHPGSLRNDIALIILDSPFQLTENVGIACLPPQGTNFNAQRCIASGWGKNSFKKGAYQSTLKKMNLPIVPHDHCLRSLRNARLGPYFHLHRSFICAGGEANKDTCKGDGGSPLICPVEGQADRYQQAGIVSWGLTCGLRNTPGVYVNVALFSDWIDQQMINHKFDTKIYRS